MKKEILLGVLAVMVLASSVVFAKGQPANPGSQGQEKVTICHIPPGNPDNKHTITVATAAVEAHLAHGDTLGECVDAPPPFPQ